MRSQPKGGSSVGLESIAGTDVELRNALKAERLPVDDLAEAGRTFFRVREGANTLGFGGYEILGEHALIRSLVVLPEARKRGIGRRVTEQILEHARKRGRPARLSAHRVRPPNCFGSSAFDPSRARRLRQRYWPRVRPQSFVLLQPFC